MSLLGKYKTAVYLFYYEGYSGAEIANIFGIPRCCGGAGSSGEKVL